MIAIDEFRQIMTKPAPMKDEDEGMILPNPLLRGGGEVPEDMEKTIAPD